MDKNLLKHLQQPEWLSAGHRLLVGLSGGVDSVVLLHLLRRLAGERRLVLQAAHLDHAIRAESREDAYFVAQLCSNWDIPLVVERCDVPVLARDKKISLEMAAREARQAFLLRTAEQLDVDYILLAHHRDDQAETFLLRLLRGTGLSGLAGMWMQSEKWLRPLLDVSREEIVEYARVHKLEWVEDDTNSDVKHLRNRVRHQLLPVLREYNPRLEERLTLLCRQQQQEEDFWQQQVEQVFPGLIVADEDGLRLCRDSLLNLHPALRVRVLREAIRRQRGDLQKFTEKHLVAMGHLLQGEQSQASLDLPGLWVARRYDQVWLRTAPPETESYCLQQEGPGQLSLPDGRCIKVELDSEIRGETVSRVEFSADQLDWPLQIRTFREGDRFSPSGAGGSKKLKDFFIDIKLEAELRQQVPLVISGEQIVWIAGVRRSVHAPAGESRSQVLRLELTSPENQG